MADCASKIHYDNGYKFLPFKSHSDNSRLKFSKKRIDFEISAGDIYPGEIVKNRIPKESPTRQNYKS
jgi:hypothetical protein